MCGALVEPNSPRFFDLYSQGQVLADEIDDFIDRWHDGADTRGHSLSLHEYLGLTPDEYEVWVLDPDALPCMLMARREARPLRGVMSRYLDDLSVTARASDTATVKALRCWLTRQQSGEEGVVRDQHRARRHQAFFL
jgi:hypothetical protein